MSVTFGKKGHGGHMSLAAQHATGGKRRPALPLVQSSSDEDDSDQDTSKACNTRLTNNLTIEIPNSATSPVSPPIAALADHDYDNVASPGSSTASGPIYVRPPGFTYHGQQITVTQSKSKKKKIISFEDGLKGREPTPPKLKPRRDPLPMRLRALPQSFWQEPNNSSQVSPANQVSAHVLPPLLKLDSKNLTEDIMDVRPVTPPEEKPIPEKEKNGKCTNKKAAHLTSTVANTDLLFKLFEGIEEKKAPSTVASGLYNTPTPPATYKRGRPRKLLTTSRTSRGPLVGEDPCISECISDKLFPKLKRNGSKQLYSNHGHTSLQVVTLRQGDKTFNLPQLAMEQNYSQMLSELVMKL